MVKQKIKIEGMTCSACSSSIEKVVKKLKGVTFASVNLMDKTLICRFDEKVVSLDDIYLAIVECGFNPIKEDVKKDIKKPYSFKLFRVISNGVLSLIIFYLAMGPMWNLPLPGILKSDKYFSINAFLQCLLCLVGIFINIKYFIRGANHLFHHSSNMDTLVSIGSGASFIYSLISCFLIIYNSINLNTQMINSLFHHLYFDSAIMILFFVSIGKYLEGVAETKTLDAIAGLRKLSPNEAIQIIDGKQVKVSTKDLKVGDHVLFRPGDNFCSDGIVLEGNSFVNEASLTGESVPVLKKEKDLVYCGTSNVDGSLLVEVTKNPSDTLLSKIIQLVEEASVSKAPISKLVDKVSRVFVPIVLSISLLTFIVWMIISKDFYTSFKYAISVVVISCPCALGLATPVAITVSMGACSKKGILIKDYSSLEKINQVTTFVFDKTGTLTKGNMVVEKIIYLNESEEKINSILYSLEWGSNHPIAKAITDRFEKMQIEHVRCSDFLNVQGMGVEGCIFEKIYYLGNSSFIKQHLKNDLYFPNTGDYIGTILYLANDEELIAMVFINDELNPTSVQTVHSLKKIHKNVAMITGDNKLVADDVGKKLGIDEIYSEVLPQEKYSIIKKLQSNHEVVAFVGDGINDSVALSASDVGIAVGKANDIALDSSGIILLNNNLEDILYVKKVSKLTLGNIKQNLFWALIYNICAIPIASGVLSSLGIQLNPMIGAFCMSLSSLFVVGNALRMKIKYNKM